MASSQRQSWFARHCTPPPPINEASACPCASCFNRSSSFSSTTSTSSSQASSPDVASPQTASWPSWSRRKSSRRVYQSTTAAAGAGDSTTALLPTPGSDAQSVRSYNMTEAAATGNA